MNYIEKIIKIMDKKRISQKEICTALDISTSTFSNWKNRNTDPPAKYLKPICNYIGISYSDLIEGESQDSHTTFPFEWSAPTEEERQEEIAARQNMLLNAYKKMNDTYHSVETETCLLFYQLPMEDKLEIMADIVNRTKKYSGDE